MTYLAYHENGDEGKTPPIAAGQDRDAVLAIAMFRTLTWGWTRGSISIVKRDDVTDDDVAQIEDAIIAFTKKGEA